MRELISQSWKSVKTEWIHQGSIKNGDDEVQTLGNDESRKDSNGNGSKNWCGIKEETRHWIIGWTDGTGWDGVN